MCLVADTGGSGDRQPTHPGPFMAAGNERHRDMQEGLIASCLLFLILYVLQSSESLSLCSSRPLLCPILLLVPVYFSPARTSPTLPGSSGVEWGDALESGLGWVSSPLSALTAFFQPLSHMKWGQKLQSICEGWLDSQGCLHLPQGRAKQSLLSHMQA